MRRRRDKPRPLSELVRKIHPAPDQVDAARVFGWWCSALPERIVAKARPVRLERGILIVHVTSSAWAQELHHMSADLMIRLRKAGAGASLKAMRFRVGPLPDLPRMRARDVREPSAIPIVALPEDLGRALATVGDDAVRQAVASAATSSLAREKTKKR